MNKIQIASTVVDMRSGPTVVDTPRARELGAALRQARLAKHMTLRQVADAVGRAESHTSRWENGKLIPSAEDLGALLVILGISGDERERLIQLAHEIDNPDWVAAGIDKQLAALIETERIAKQIVFVEPTLVPGLLQTGEYAYSIICARDGNSSQARHDALIRIGRQSILTRRNPPDLVCAVGESALRYPPCTASIMAEQLHHLLKAMQQPNITVVVVPNELGCYSPAVFGSFQIVDPGDNRPMVQLGSFWSSTTLTNMRAIDAYREAAAITIRHSLGVEKSAALIEKLMNEMESKA
jgi:transcriptional regulator with XRE-family HTH domain